MVQLVRTGPNASVAAASRGWSSTTSVLAYLGGRARARTLRAEELLRRPPDEAQASLDAASKKEGALTSRLALYGTGVH